MSSISIRGRYLFNGDRRFFVRGVVYQTGNSADAISDERLPELKRDIPMFIELGINTILVYSIDGSKDHDQAMTLLDEAGIYVLFTVTSPSNCIRRSEPEKSYNPTTVTSYCRKIDCMSKYRNTLGAFVASNLVNNQTSTAVLPYLGAAVRDMKRYMTVKKEATGQRTLPIGYAAAAGELTSLHVLSSGDTSSAIDFWACQNFSWTGASEPESTALMDKAKTSNIPIFFSEYSSPFMRPRLFEETRSLLSPPMRDVFSGGCVYEFWRSANDYGLVEMILHPEDPSSRVHQKAMKRASDPTIVAEKRATDDGLLVIYHDFVNYRASLEATQDFDVDEQGEPDAEQVWTQEIEIEVPASCIDWAIVEQNLT